MRIPIRHYSRLLFTYLKPQWHRTFLLTILLLINISLQLFNPQLLKNFIDAALTNGATISLLVIAMIFIGVAVLNQGVAVGVTYLSEYVAWTATNQLRTDLVAHCLSLDMSFHETKTSGEMIERVDGDVDALSNFFSQFVGSLLSNGLLLFGVLVLLFLISWFVGVIMALFAIFSLVILLFLRKRAIPLQLALRQMSATFFSFISEYLISTEDVRAIGAVEYIMRRFYLLLRRWRPIYGRAVTASNIMTITALFLFISGNAIALSLGAYLWSIKAISVGTVYLIFAYTDLLAQPLKQIQMQLQDLQQAEACIQRVEGLLHTAPVISQHGEVDLPSGAISVEFTNVSFGYTENIPILRNVTVCLPPGKVLGVLGRTGSGKTTFARLLLRLYEPQSGKIHMNSVPIDEMKLQDLRKRVGMVTQNVQLFHATVRDNLTFFNYSIPDDQILRRINEVGLSTWYHKLPDGLNTKLHASGEGLSAGEAQLLAFTRILLANPDLVILDEASSRLDPATESLIERAIDRLLVGRTGIVIAHRMTTLQRADDILVIEDGQVVEHGKREVLAGDPASHFSRLLRTDLEEEYI